MILLSSGLTIHIIGLYVTIHFPHSKENVILKMHLYDLNINLLNYITGNEILTFKDFEHKRRQNFQCVVPRLSCTNSGNTNVRLGLREASTGYRAGVYVAL